METEVKEFQATSLDELFGTSAEPKEEISFPEKSEVPEEKKEDVKPEEKPEKKSEKGEEKKDELPSPVEEGDLEELSPAETKWVLKMQGLQEELDKAKERLKTTRDWDTRVNKENLELKRQLEIINQKLDGTYEEGVTNEPSPEDIKAQSEYQGRFIASDKIAKEQYGEEYVQKMLYAPDAPFQKLNQDPAVHYRVYNSETPALEALKIMKEYEFFSKYGRDTDKIEAKIRESLETELREKITKEFKEKLKQKENQPKGLSGIASEPPSNDKSGFKPASTKELFG